MKKTYISAEFITWSRWKCDAIITKIVAKTLTFFYYAVFSEAILTIDIFTKIEIYKFIK